MHHASNGDIYYEFVKGNLNNLDLIDFIRKVTDDIAIIYPNKRIIMVADNARMHKTVCFKSIFTVKRINLVYTVANNPMLNPIEYLFRFLKTELRKVYTLN